MTRSNPNACFEMDAMSNMANWQSVIPFGTFRELKGRDAEKARHYYLNMYGHY